MRTAVSIPDEVFEEAEATARRLGISRSQLFTRAVAEYVAARRGQRITEALDRVHGQEPGGVDPLLADLQARSVVDRDDA